jgi:hypothetical protein
MKYEEEISTTTKVLGTFVLAGLIIILFILWTFFINGIYFSNIRPALVGDWAGAAEIYTLLYISPVIVILSILLSAWLIIGNQKITTKLPITIILFVIYGGIYFSALLKGHLSI